MGNVDKQHIDLCVCVRGCVGGKVGVYGCVSEYLHVGVAVCIEIIRSFTWLMQFRGPNMSKFQIDNLKSDNMISKQKQDLYSETSFIIIIFFFHLTIFVFCFFHLLSFIIFLKPFRPFCYHISYSYFIIHVAFLYTY